MTPANENKRGFLFLQGPHGPFYAELSQHLEDLGHKPGGWPLIRVTLRFGKIQEL